MHHARHRQIHAMGAAIVERVRDAMREESAGSGTTCPRSLVQG